MPITDILTSAFWTTGWSTAQYVVLALGLLLIAVALKAFTKLSLAGLLDRIPDLGKARQFVGGLSAVVAILLVLMTPLSQFIGFEAPLALIAPEEVLEEPLVPVIPGVPPVTAAVITPQVAAALPIDTFNVQIMELHSNDYTSVDGFLEIYVSNVDPSTPTANALLSVAISSGIGSDANGIISVDTPYRVVWNGGGVWYDKDYGVITFQSAAYNSLTGNYRYQDFSGVAKIATLDDMLTETDTGGDVVNGQSENNAGSELFGGSDTLTYNATTGDGTFYIKPTISVSGGNKEVQGLVYCYEFDSTNPPEGNELSSLTYQLESGVSLGFQSDMLPFWSSESCLALGGAVPVKGGTSSQVRFTYTITESNLEVGGDIWREFVDDLGDINGKSILLSTGAASDSIQFDTVV